MPRVLIFGASGQDGHYLTGLHERGGDDVLGVSRSGSPIQADVGSFEQVHELVRGHQPDVVYHLAATSTTGHEALFANHNTIGTGTLNVLESVYRCKRDCKVFIAGSGLQFVNSGKPIRETDSFAPTSCYSVERIHAAYAARYYRELGLRTYVGYLFHHESPLRKPSHMSQRVVQAVKRIAHGSDERIELGDITVQKEWGFAGDIAEGMVKLVQQDDVSEAVIGTGRAHSIEEWLQVCFASIGEDWRRHTVLKEGFHTDFARLVSDPCTMHSLGWVPRVSFEGLAELMLQA